MTHTFAELEISPAAYDEILAKVKAAGYRQAYETEGLIDMSGIALTRGPHWTTGEQEEA